MKRSKKEVDRLLKQLDEMASKESNMVKSTSCSTPGHVVIYEKNEDGSYNTICYSCKVYPL